LETNKMEHFETLPENLYSTLTGTTKEVFEEVFARFCGEDTPIKTRNDLFHLLYFFKCYPTLRVLQWQLQIKCVRNLNRKLGSWIKHLASAMDVLISDQWGKRTARSNTSQDIRTFFVGQCVGAVDTFPVLVERPKDAHQQRGVYSGKYCTHILKVQMVVSNSGVPMYVTGPHLGVTGDAKLWQQHGPPMAAQVVLGDKAYCGEDGVIAPHKKRRYQAHLAQEQVEFNLLHRFYRSTVEHSFAQIKKYRILGATYRGKPFKKGGARLKAIIRIVTALVVLQTVRRPLKDLSKSILTVDEKQLVEHVAQEVKVAVRQYVLGWPVGTTDDVKQVVEPNGRILLVGPGPEPASDLINFGYQTEDVTQGDLVWCWWWGRMWRARITYLSHRQQVCNIRWMRDGSTDKMEIRFIAPMV